MFYTGGHPILIRKVRRREKEWEIEL